MVLGLFFGRSAKPTHRIYAIGDVGGNATSLRDARSTIDRDMLAHRDSHATIVYMGDYVDRGLEAYETLDFLAQESMRDDNIERVFLKGNHDILFLNFLQEKDPRKLHKHFCNLLENGGLQTFASYGVYLDPLDLTPNHPADWNAETLGLKPLHARKVQLQMQQAVPPSHIAFLQSLSVKHNEANLFFCHGGVDVTRPLDDQDEKVLTGSDTYRRADGALPISRQFATYRGGPVDGKTIVVGHSKVSRSDVERARVADGRIPTDTGAYNRYLTAVVLERPQDAPHFEKVGHIFVRSTVSNYDRYAIPKAAVSATLIQPDGFSHLAPSYT